MFCTTPGVALARAVGRKRAVEMLLTGDAIDAGTAYSWGLVNRVVEDERVLPEADAWARSLCERPRQGLAATKQALRRHATETYAGSIESEAHLQGPLVETDDSKEGFAAFVEQRKPRFGGS